MSKWHDRTTSAGRVLLALEHGVKLDRESTYQPPTIIESRDVDENPRHGTVTERRPGFVVTEAEGGESLFDKGMKWEMEHGPPTAGSMKLQMDRETLREPSEDGMDNFTKASFAVVEEAAKDSHLYNHTVQAALNEVRARLRSPSVREPTSTEGENDAPFTEPRPRDGSQHQGDVSDSGGVDREVGGDGPIPRGQTDGHGRGRDQVSGRVHEREGGDRLRPTDGVGGDAPGPGEGSGAASPEMGEPRDTSVGELRERGKRP